MLRAGGDGDPVKSDKGDENGATPVRGDEGGELGFAGGGLPSFSSSMVPQ